VPTLSPSSASSRRLSAHAVAGIAVGGVAILLTVAFLAARKRLGSCTNGFGEWTRSSHPEPASGSGRVAAQSGEYGQTTLALNMPGRSGSGAPSEVDEFINVASDSGIGNNRDLTDKSWPTSIPTCHRGLAGRPRQQIQTMARVESLSSADIASPSPVTLSRPAEMHIVGGEGVDSSAEAALAEISATPQLMGKGATSVSTLGVVVGAGVGQALVARASGSASFVPLLPHATSCGQNRGSSSGMERHLSLTSGEVTAAMQVRGGG
jgi:hypothetical protein